MRAVLSAARERRLLQAAMALACLVPLSAGGAGALTGAAMVGVPDGPANLDSHMRYLSGLLLGIGLGFLTAIPRVERAGTVMRVLGALVVIGGFARLGGLSVALPSTGHQLALIMELAVTPALVLWQARVARRCAPA